MRWNLSKSLSPLLLLVFVLFSTSSRAATYDIAADWSDVSNPNDAWAYGFLSNVGAFTSFPLHVPSYINVGPPGFSGQQPAWTRCANTGNNGCPEGLARSTGIALLDFPLGRVGGHTPLTGWLAVQWTAPSDGVIDIWGDTWMFADFQGRRLVTSLLLNGAPIFESILIPTQAQGTSSASPYTFAQAVTDSGGSPSALLGIAIHGGDTLTWAATKAPNSVEWFAGIDMTVNFSPVPEASTFSMVAIGLLVVLWTARRRKMAGTHN